MARGGRKLRVGQEIQRLLAESLRTDLKILWMTLLVVLRREGVDDGRGPGMERFTGGNRT